MAKTYAQIQKQIEQLQREAQTLRQQEIGGVIARIKEAIGHYGLTADDLFGTATKRAGTKRGARPAAKAARKPVAAKRATNPPKYRDEAGNTWTGRGKRPGWFKAALAAGKSPADLEIK